MLKKKFLKKENISHLFTEVKKFHKFTIYTQKSDQVARQKIHSAKLNEILCHTRI